MPFFAGGSAEALTNQFRLDIGSKVCVVDVVQDGGSETVQAPSPECETILPNLLTTIPATTATGQALRPALPFAGEQNPAGGLIVAQPSVDQSWSPIASTTQSGAATQPVIRLAAAAATGVSAVAVVGFLAIDVVVFEFQHTLRIVRWMYTNVLESSMSAMLKAIIIFGAMRSVIISMLAEGAVKVSCHFLLPTSMVTSRVIVRCEVGKFFI
jgi:hypothetical protein